MVVARLCILLRLCEEKKKTYGNLMVMCRMEKQKGEAAKKESAANWVWQDR